MIEVQEYLAKRARIVEAALEEALPSADTRPRPLHEAMRYMVFSGGKRLRPVLCLAAAEAAGGDPACATPAAVAVELLHTYTLIHDDLPCMDDDDTRRGKPTCHKVYGVANAVLAGDAMQALAFTGLAHPPAPPPYPPGQLLTELGEAAGSRGIIAGQVVDMALAGGTLRPDRETLDYVHLNKTAVLFRAALRMGGIAAGAGTDDLARLTTYGTALGLAFQLTDDLLDEAAPGEPQEGASYLALVTPDEVRRRSRDLLDQAIAAARQLAAAAHDPLVALANWIATRTH